MRRALGFLCIESWVILLLCAADLLTTLVFLQKGMAEEGNPIMKFYLEHSALAFIAVKGVLVIGPLVIIEWGRRHRPISVRKLARVAAFGYAGIYLGLFLQVNGPEVFGTTASVPPYFENPNYAGPVDVDPASIDKRP
ncbi:MAG: hypothetical protein HUU60_05895 [Armatimonadetes bacterium]|nr:hypothetical protein [Armatimonadota bacterium]